MLVLLLVLGMVLRHFFMCQRKNPLSSGGVSSTPIPPQWALASMNPLQPAPVGNRAVSSTNPLEPPAPVTVVTVETVLPVQPTNLWKLNKDETDTWYVNMVTNETVWTLPTGGIIVE